jgi:hypothetical protein
MCSEGCKSHTVIHGNFNCSGSVDFVDFKKFLAGFIQFNANERWLSDMDQAGFPSSASAWARTSSLTTVERCFSVNS